MYTENTFMRLNENFLKLLIISRNLFIWCTATSDVPYSL